MAEKKNQLFRQKTVDAVQSPESLNEYLHVTSPSIWLLMSALIVILAGVFVWSIFGHIDARAPVAIMKTDEGTVCFVPENALSSVIENPVVKVDDKELSLKPNVLEPVIVNEDMNIYVILYGQLQVGQIVYPIDVVGTISDDVVQGSVVTESITPISFLLN